MAFEHGMTMHGDGSISSTMTAQVLRATTLGAYEMKSGGKYEESTLIIRMEGRRLTPALIQDLEDVRTFFEAHEIPVVVE